MSAPSDLRPKRGNERVAAVMDRIVERAVELIGGADGATVELVEDDDLTAVAAAGRQRPVVGTRQSLYASLSGRAVRDDATLWCDDVSRDPRVDAGACRRLGIGSMVCVPLRRGARLIGALTVSAEKAQAFTGRDVEILAQLGEFVTTCITAARDVNKTASAVLSVQSDRLGPSERLGISSFVAHVVDPSAAEAAEAAERVATVLERELLAVQLQPVLELATMRLAGAEALARFGLAPDRPAAQWFADAKRAGLGAPLQLLALRRAIEAADTLPPFAFIAVNLDADGVRDESARELLRAAPRPVVVELTDHGEEPQLPSLRRALTTLREQGGRIAIDDTGTGFASLSRIVELSPDLIKLEARLVHRIEADPVRRSLVTAVVTFASETGAQVVAQGIERRAELELVRSLGVAYGQGYLLGRPAAPQLLDVEFAGVDSAFGS